MIRASITRPALLGALLFGLCACDSRGASSDANAVDALGADSVLDGATSPDASIDAQTDAPPACPTDVDAQAGHLCVLNVRGRVLDVDNSPVGDNIVTVCGLQCYFGRSDATGTFVVTPASFLPWQQYAVQIHGRPDHASLYVPLTMPASGEVTFDAPIRAPRYTDTGGLLPDPAVGGSVTAGDVTLTVTAGTALQFNIEDAELGDLGHSLRSVFVPLSLAPPFAREGRVVQVHALAPFYLMADRPMGLRIANRAALAAGAAVEFVAMGHELAMDPVNAGHAVVVATGRVSADGATVSADAGQGILAVTWVGVRLAGS